jgi:hypothetical protein
MLILWAARLRPWQRWAVIHASSHCAGPRPRSKWVSNGENDLSSPLLDFLERKLFRASGLPRVGPAQRRRRRRDGRGARDPSRVKPGELQPRKVTRFFSCTAVWLWPSDHPRAGLRQSLPPRMAAAAPTNPLLLFTGAYANTLIARPSLSHPPTRRSTATSCTCADCRVPAVAATPRPGGAHMAKPLRTLIPRHAASSPSAAAAAEGTSHELILLLW